MHPTTIEIDKAQFILNLQSIISWVKQNANSKSRVKICLPVKANAYGHGLVAIAKLSLPYVDYLAVSCLNEAITLRQNGITIPILVFGGFSQEQIEQLVTNRLEITIPSLIKAKQLEDVCSSLKIKCNVQIKIDTGMRRIGVRPDTALSIVDYVNNSQFLHLSGIYSHLASSDNNNDLFTYNQLREFTTISQKIKRMNPDIICHIANSGGVCYYPESYFDMVRPGILSYGYFPEKHIEDYPLNLIKPCFSLKSQVIYFKVVAPHSGISYNQTYVTNSQTRIVTIPIGYGDGYPRILSNNGDVLIGGHKYTISGAICMDMLMVDIGVDNSAYIGDQVVLIGKQGYQEIRLADVAKKCQTITYEILCSFNERIPRIYV